MYTIIYNLRAHNQKSAFFLSWTDDFQAEYEGKLLGDSQYKGIDIWVDEVFLREHRSKDK